MPRFRPLKPLIARLAGLALVVTALPCAAQLRLDVPPDKTTAVHRTDASSSALFVPATPARASARSFSPSSGSNWIDTAVQLEEPRATSTGEYTRPKFRVGVPSETMRGFMNSAGFSADKCQLPMVRARTKSSGDSGINGTLWLFASCTFR